MNHLQPFQPRKVLALPVAKKSGWKLKQYAIIAAGRNFDDKIMSSALAAACERLPGAGGLHDETGNHGVGFQIVHFAEVAVVSPVFYWQWGSVLANTGQMRAPWEAPTIFGNGVEEVVGCIWEMEVVCYEIHAWKSALLGNVGTLAERLEAYLEKHFVMPSGSE